MRGLKLAFQCNSKKAIKEAIETEKLKQTIVDDGYSIQQYFDKYVNADFDDTETRNTILAYFLVQLLLKNVKNGWQKEIDAVS